MIRRPPRSTRTDTLFPYTTRFRSARLHDHRALLHWRPAGGGYPAQGPAPRPRRRAVHDPHLDRRRARHRPRAAGAEGQARSEEHTSELQPLMRISYAVFCLKKKKKSTDNRHNIRVVKNTYTEQKTQTLTYISTTTQVNK